MTAKEKKLCLCVSDRSSKMFDLCKICEVAVCMDCKKMTEGTHSKTHKASCLRVVDVGFSSPGFVDAVLYLHREVRTATMGWLPASPQSDL
jgi:hypothetical protein